MKASDIISGFIMELLEQSGGNVELQRNELAQHFNVVPSQINYVITSRFTPEHGYICLVYTSTILNEQEIRVVARERAAEIVDKAKNDALRMKSVTVNYLDQAINEAQRSLEQALKYVKQAKDSYDKYEIKSFKKI